MKNLTKIFMAIAVAMFAFSCVNDTTEDIAVKVGGKTTLAISLGGVIVLLSARLRMVFTLSLGQRVTRSL